MVAYMGMSAKLPNLCYYNTQESFVKPYSDTTARLIDEEVQRIISEQYERAKQLLSKYAEQHNMLAELLCEKEVIFAKDVEDIFGPRPWRSRAEVLLTEQPQAKDNEDKKGEN